MNGVLRVPTNVAIKVKMAGTRSRSAPTGPVRPPIRKSPKGHHVKLSDPIVKKLAAGFLIAGILLLVVFAIFYVKYEGIVDKRMSGQIFNNAAKIYARPEIVMVGEKTSAPELMSYLRRAGYTEQGKEGGSAIGQFRQRGSTLDVMPG